MCNEYEAEDDLTFEEIMQILEEELLRRFEECEPLDFND